MATAVSDPIVLDRTIIAGTDHYWTFRRVNEDGEPLIPTEVKAQIRDTYDGILWAEFSSVIDPVDGWITLHLPEEDTLAKPWATRTEGVWDVEVIFEGDKLRWVMGAITVSPEVTRPNE